LLQPGSKLFGGGRRTRRYGIAWWDGSACAVKITIELGLQLMEQIAAGQLVSQDAPDPRG
jgi:hypothetical protein